MSSTDVGAGTALVQSFRAAAGGRLSASPVISTLLLAVVAEPELGAPLEAAGPEARLQPTRLFTAVHHLLRTTLPEHPLAHYYPVLEGPYPPDGGLVDAFRDLVSTHGAELGRLCRRPLRQDDPLVWSIVRPAVSRAAAAHPGRQVALVELGATAGLGLLLDHYRFDYGTDLVGDGPVHLACRLLGDTPQDLHHPFTVGSRVGLDPDPVVAADVDAVDWLLSGVWPEDVSALDRLEPALSLLREVEVDLRGGQLPDLLPAALADLPDDELPVLVGSPAPGWTPANDPLAAVPAQLAAAGRDLVWVMAEPAGRALPLVTAGTVEADAAEHVLTAVTYRDGSVTDVSLLGRFDARRTWLDWDPTPLAPR
ncbi:MAG: DUF2332 family protein [Nocardioidaceae bacterium]